MVTHIALAKLCWALGKRKSSESGKEIWKEGEGLGEESEKFGGQPPACIRSYETATEQNLLMKAQIYSAKNESRAEDRAEKTDRKYNST